MLLPFLKQGCPMALDWRLGPPPGDGGEPSTVLGSGTPRHSHHPLAEKAVSEAPRVRQEPGVKQGPRQHLSQAGCETGTQVTCRST